MMRQDWDDQATLAGIPDVLMYWLKCPVALAAADEAFLRLAPGAPHMKAGECRFAGFLLPDSCRYCAGLLAARM